MTEKKILIVSGEPSGDLHASNLVKEMKAISPDLRFFGIGGALSRLSGVDTVFDITKLALVGAVEVLKHASTVKSAHDAVIGRVRRERPDLAILVDYPGFNLKLARDLHRAGIPVAYYISPQVWAWGRQRVHLIKKYVRKMFVFFEFEKEFYSDYGIEAEFVGHPLIDTVKVTSDRKATMARHGLSPDRQTIALLPGSRDSEISVIMPALAGAAEMISEKLPEAQFVISKHPDKSVSAYDAALNGASFRYVVAEGDLHNIVGASDFAIVASGTATLETAMIGTPFIVVYKASLLTYILYKIVADIPYLCLANIIAGKEIVPELLQFNMTAGKIASRAVGLISDSSSLSSMRENLAAVKASLGAPGASKRAALAIIKLLS